MHNRKKGGVQIRPAWVAAAGLGVFALVAVGVPLVSLLYVGILLLCPLLMAGMHGGQGRARGHCDPGGPDRAESSDPGASSAREAGPPGEGRRT